MYIIYVHVHVCIIQCTCTMYNVHVYIHVHVVCAQYATNIIKNIQVLLTMSTSLSGADLSTYCPLANCKGVF